jgi:superfamily II DNA or RNA helicase
LPTRWCKAVVIGNNTVNQLYASAADRAVIEESGGLLWAVCGPRRWRVFDPDETYDSDLPGLRLRKRVVNASGVRLTESTWIGLADLARPEVVRESLAESFSFIREDRDGGKKGLRPPQIGALHAVMGYLTLNQQLPATVVMPTGTGKTETMLSLFAAERIGLLLVLVPSDALRDQLARKFETYGVLREFGIIGEQALYPAVCKLCHGLKAVEAAASLANSCNVIVATPQVLGHTEPEARSALLERCSHLFVDEAHHIAAPTWRDIRNAFTGKPVVQFTATPFREDGADLGGKLVYVFPLRSAQEQGYFSRINYTAVVDFDDQDAAIAAKAVERLRDDLSRGLDHILMARVNRIGRAKDLLPTYERLAPDLKPVILHSQLTPKKTQRDALALVRRGESRIIICVDMLGEGFDLPTLKVAAMHDTHKSLGITLQFIGRFARASGARIGEATVVVGRSDPDYDENLKKLYAEDPDWNHLINNLSAAAVGEQEELGEFEEGFRVLPEEVSMRSVSPRMSTVVYRTFCEAWQTDELDRFFEGRLYTNPIAVNEAEHVVWLVTKEVEQVRWGDTKAIEEIAYDLYAFHWDTDRGLLYINSSNNDSVHEDVAKALCGDTVELIKGPSVYRAMAKILRRVPTNVGLLDARNRKRSFAMFSGSNVTEAFPTAEAQTKTQTNLFAYGYESGERVSLGISLKGRIWSYQAAPTLKHWVDWCNIVGSRLIDETIDIREVIASFIKPEDVEVRPSLVPLALEWPWEVYTSLTEDLRLERSGQAYPLIDVELEITEFKDNGPIPFTLVTPAWTADYSLVIGKGRLDFSSVGDEVSVVTSRASKSLSSLLNSQGLRVIFEREAVIETGCILVRPNRDLSPFDPENLTILDWTGIDLHKESQGAVREPSSIQARMIREIRSLSTWDVILDDDTPGEIADIVAIRVEGRWLIVMLTHCKYSLGDPGGRIEDLYEVCGQAQRSAEWRRKPELMLRHLIRREKNRRLKGRSGFEVGTPEKLVELADRSPFLLPVFHIAIAQPGVSKEKVSDNQLNLLAGTEVYVKETADSAFSIFISP